MTKRERKSYLLRIDEELWNRLNEWAASELRSVNSQIEMILRQAVEEHKGKKNKSPESGPSSP
jgi:hypothetical protein